MERTPCHECAVTVLVLHCAYLFSVSFCLGRKGCRQDMSSGYLVLHHSRSKFQKASLYPPNSKSWQSLHFGTLGRSQNNLTLVMALSTISFLRAFFSCILLFQKKGRAWENLLYQLAGQGEYPVHDQPQALRSSLLLCNQRL